MSIKVEQEKNRQPEQLIASGVTAQCRQCNWQITGELTIETELNQPLDQGGIVNDCRQHHEATRKPKGSCSDHNVFDLFYAGNKAGHVIVGSRVVAGHFYSSTEERRFFNN